MSNAFMNCRDCGAVNDTRNTICRTCGKRFDGGASFTLPNDPNVTRACEEEVAARGARGTAPAPPAGEVQPVARVVSSGPEANLPCLEWLSANVSLSTPIGSMLYAAPINEAAAPVQTMQGLAEFLRGLRSHSLYANASEKRRANISRWISEVEAARAAPVARMPLSDDEVRKIYRHVFAERTAPHIYGLAEMFARAVETAHGIVRAAAAIGEKEKGG